MAEGHGNNFQIVLESPARGPERKQQVNNSAEVTEGPHLQTRLRGQAKQKPPCLSRSSSASETASESPHDGDGNSDSEYQEGKSQDKAKLGRPKRNGKAVPPSKKAAASTAHHQSSEGEAAISRKAKSYLNMTKETAVEQLAQRDAKIEKDSMQLKKFRQSLKDSKKREADQQGELKESRATIREQTETITRFRNEQLELLHKDKCDVETDNELASKLSSLFDDTRDWTKSWAARRLANMKIGAIIRMFSRAQRRSLRLFASECAIVAFCQGHLSPAVVMNALVNRELCFHTFQRPFGNLPESCGGIGKKSAETFLEWVMERAEQGS